MRLPGRWPNLGWVSFTNDDGSGRIDHATLVRFDVAEGFKGIGQIWWIPAAYLLL
ncbi:MAG: hypothetical protein ABSG65_29325 [Bryobacteraceae bacterium]|jgi:hypothetical protein